MKNFIVLLVAMLFVGVFTSCQKEKNFVPIDTEAIRSQLASLPVISKEEVQQKITEQNNLKSANTEPVLVRIFPLDKNTYEVYDDHAIKHLVYYELNQGAHRTKFLTLNQTFPVANGVVDTTQYHLDINVGFPFSRGFYFKDQNDINQLTFFFHFNNGEEFAYFGDNGSGSVKLPPIADGQWQINVVYNDGEMHQEFMSNLINFYGDELITLKFNILPVGNTKAYVKIDRNLINSDTRSIEVVGKDDDGNWIYFLYPINSDGLNDILSVPVSFSNITRVYVCGSNSGCMAYGVKVSPDSPINGPKIFVLSN